MGPPNHAEFLALGFAGGIGLGAILIFVIQKSYFGWSIKWT